MAQTKAVTKLFIITRKQKEDQFLEVIKMKNVMLLNILVMLLFISNVMAQQKMQDVVYLKNGSEIRGEIIELDPHSHVKIRTKDGNLFVFQVEEILRVTKESPLEEDRPESDSAATVGPISISERVDFGVKVGYFAPSEEAFSEIYGGGFVFGGELFIWSNSGLGGGITIERFGKSGEPFEFDPYGVISESKSEISVLPIAFTIAYRMPKITPNTKVRPYFGVGVGVYMVDEDLEFVYIDGSSEYASWSKSPAGFHAQGGIQVEMSPSASFVLEVKFSRASASGEGGAGGEDVNVGGFNIFGGVRF